METRKRKIANQNSSSAAKIVKEDDAKESEGGFNPLLMTEILPNILNYLDIDSLKESRLVCSFWGFEGGKILLKESNIKLESFGTKNGQLEDFLNTTGISTTFNLAIKYIRDTDTLKNALPRLLEQTTALQMNPNCYSSTDNSKLAEFLDFFPNLQILHLEGNCRVYEAFSTKTEESLLNKFESLKEIRLKFCEDNHLINLLFTKSGLAVKEIRLQGSSSWFFQRYLEYGCDWPIDSLAIDVKSLNPEFLDTLQPFLEKISGSLKILRWNLSGPLNLSAEYLVPWANNLMNSATLNGLETLLIFCESTSKIFWYIEHGHYTAQWNPATDFSWFLFTFALQLPNLKKLTLNKVPANLEERIKEWNDHPNARGRTLKNESLEELNILQYVMDSKDVKIESFPVFSLHLWPNLKSLYIEYPPNNLPASLLLSEWRGLERLDLRFGTVSKKGALLWKSWFTGGKTLKDENANQDDAKVSLKDFKDLKHFGLLESSHSQSNPILTDFLVENTLKFMTQLQSLYLETSNISQNAKKMLKETLGPNVNVEFK